MFIIMWTNKVHLVLEEKEKLYQAIFFVLPTRYALFREYLCLCVCVWARVASRTYSLNVDRSRPLIGWIQLLLEIYFMEMQKTTPNVLDWYEEGKNITKMIKYQ